MNTNKFRVESGLNLRSGRAVSFTVLPLKTQLYFYYLYPNPIKPKLSLKYISIK